MIDMKMTILLLTYKQENFVEEAIVSALEQDYANKEIVISDDASPDGTADVIRQVLEKHGASDVIVRLADSNTGIAGNLNAAVVQSSGDFLAIAAGDDVSFPHRLSSYARILSDEAPEASAIFTNSTIIDQNGTAVGPYFKGNPSFTSTAEEFIESSDCSAMGASLGFRRELFGKYGAISEKSAKEDGIIAFRAILEGGLHYSSDKTIGYRIHGSNVSQNLSVRKRIDLQRTDTMMKLGWIEDYFSSGRQSEELFSALLRSYRSSERHAKLLSIPLVGTSYMGARKLAGAARRALRR